jgi:hypothetical protein
MSARQPPKLPDDTRRSRGIPLVLPDDALHVREAVTRALWLGVYVSIAIVCLLAVLIYAYRKMSIARLNPLLISCGVPPDMRLGFIGLHNDLYTLLFLQVLCWMLMTVWWTTLGKCVYYLWSAITLGVMRYLRLRTNRNLEYSRLRRSSLKPQLAIARIAVIILAAIVITVIAVSTHADPACMLKAGFICMLVGIPTLWVLSVVHDLRTVRQADPNLLKWVYGRRSSLGEFFGCLSFATFLALLVRVGVPILFLAMTYMSKAFFSQRAANLIGAEAGVQTVNYVRSTAGVDIHGEMLSATEFNLAGFGQRHGPLLQKDLDALKAKGIRYAYWLAILVFTLELLIPMTLYSLLFCRTNPAVKVLKASFVGIGGAAAFQWFFSYMFLLPRPTFEGSAFVGLVVFTIYTTWIYDS